MSKSGLVIIGLFLGAMTLSGRTAKASVCEGECYSTDEYVITCSGSEGCKELIGISYCTFGCDGEFCSSSYGECCGGKFTEENASGACEGDVRRASKRGASRRDGLTALQGPNESILDAQPWIMFVPDRCAHTYGVIDISGS